jgi:hypothetical protein
MPKVLISAQKEQISLMIGLSEISAFRKIEPFESQHARPSCQITKCLGLYCAFFLSGNSTFVANTRWISFRGKRKKVLSAWSVRITHRSEGERTRRLRYKENRATCDERNEDYIAADARRLNALGRSRGLEGSNVTFLNTQSLHKTAGGDKRYIT